MDEALARLAAACGIEPEYWDGLGQRRTLGEATARALTAALGYPGAPGEALARRLDAAPGVPAPQGAAPVCHQPPDLGRVWGLAVQLYALRSARNWGIGDFTDLGRLCAIAGAAGAQAIGLNPLHARHLSRPDEASPYAPSSRLFVDPVALDVEATGGAPGASAVRVLLANHDFRARLDAARATPRVDFAAVTALKLTALAAAFAAWRDAADETGPANAFAAEGGAALVQFCAFEAARLGDASPAGAAGADPAFHAFLQWECDRQLGAAAAAARAAGMRIGLYRDLAVGAAADGAEVAADPELFARDIHVGAPPDLLNRDGQDWGLPPWIPERLAARGHAPFTALLRANMRHAGALRIDHVMALTRLFWIPAGAKGVDGAYVRNDFAALTALLGEASRDHACLVIGEDLGSVPHGLRDALAARGLYSYRVLLFERHWDGDGAFKRPWEYPAQALATVATHDMPTIADFWQGGDIARQEALGLLPAGMSRAEGEARRAAERAGLAALARAAGVPAPGADGAPACDSLHAILAACHASLAMVQLDDVCGEVEPVNIPGTWREYPNWTRRTSLGLEALAGDTRWLRLAATMRAAGRA